MRCLFWSGATLLLVACTPDRSAAPLRDLAWGTAAALSTGGGGDCDTLVIARATVGCGRAARDQVARDSTQRAALMDASTGAAPLGQRALVDLWYGIAQPEALDRAVRALRDEARNQDTNADLLSDLSAALLERYAARNSPDDLLEALDAARRAVQRAPNARHAAWNAAVAITWLGLREAHEPAWQRVRELGVASVPVVDLRGDPLRMTPQQAALSGHWRDASMEYAWRELLPAWAAGVLAGDSARVRAARSALDIMSTASANADPVDGPAALLAVVRHVRPPQATRDLAGGVLAYAESRRALDDARRDDAAAALARAKASPMFVQHFARWVWYQAGNIALYRVPAQAVQLLAANRARITGQAPVTERRARWTSALARMSMGQQAPARDELVTLADDCQRAQEYECSVAAAAMSASIESMLGNDDRGARLAVQALQLSATIPLNTRRWTALNTLRRIAVRRQLLSAADAIDEELEAVARQLGDADLQLLASLGRVRFALAQMERARTLRADTLAATAVRHFETLWREQAADTARQQEFEGDLLWARGELGRLRGDRRSVAVLDSSVQAALSWGNRVRLVPFQLSRARATLQLRDTNAGLAELDTLLAEYRARGRRDPTVFEEARLANEMRAARIDAARALLAQRRYREVLAVLSNRDRADTAITVLTSSTTWLAFRELGDSLVRFTTNGSGLVVHVLPMRVSVLRSLVTRTDSAALRETYAALLTAATPVAVTPGARLTIDGQGVAATVPWPALRAPNGRYLIDDHELRLAIGSTGPSTTTGHAPNVPPKRGTGMQRVAIIDAAPRSGAARLPGATTETIALANVWGEQANVVRPTALTPPAVMQLLAQMNRADVVHYAGHALLDADHPERSALHIPVMKGDSLLTAATMSGWSLPRVRLMILAACDTRASSSNALGGLESLAGVLQRAGVANVIGAGWPVSDKATAHFMQQLHEQLYRGASPAAALRSAQLSLRHDRDPTRNNPRVWAAFQLLGRGE